jgi:hypothetical protein
MSACPKCGAASGHRGVVVPWSGDGPMAVLHHCPRDGLWSEPVNDIPAMSYKVRMWVMKAEANGNLESDEAALRRIKEVTGK